MYAGGRNSLDPAEPNRPIKLRSAVTAFVLTLACLLYPELVPRGTRTARVICLWEGANVRRPMSYPPGIYCLL